MFGPFCGLDKVLIHDPLWTEWPCLLSMCWEIFTSAGEHQASCQMSGATFFSSALTSHLDHSGY